MPDTTVTNWFGDVVSHPKVIVEAKSESDIIAVLKDPTKYPSPVRAIGSNHSTPPCGVADGGTLIKMSNMNRILDISSNTVTAQAGALLSRKALHAFKKRLDYREYGGAPLLGVRGVCIVAHGSSNDRAIMNGIRVAAEFAQAGINDRIEREFRDGFLPGFLADLRLVEAADFDRLATPELVEEIGRLHRRFTGDTHVEVDVINIAANFYLARARRALSDAGLEPSSFMRQMAADCALPAWTHQVRASQRRESQETTLLIQDFESLTSVVRSEPSGRTRRS